VKNLFLVILLAPLALLGAETGYRLDKSPHESTDLVSLQAGAKLYVNYCLGCHSMQYVRYGGLSELGLTEQQIKDNLLFTGEKVGEPMKGPMDPKSAKQWFGVAPPDLSVVSRSRGADWLYTYLRTFYRDPNTATGWNNAVFENVGMPHALWTLQGERAYEREKRQWKEISKGALSQVEYDTAVRDLVNFLAYVGEPAAQSRKHIGAVVLFVLSILFVLAYALKKVYWKDVH
jgi:ubiquinol-cytochrome c reductase cytochrome c1 subunit